MEHLKKLILDKGIKQTWLAQKINRTPQELTMWLNSTRPMPDEIKKQLQDLLK
jgi:hypothetical protein